MPYPQRSPHAENSFVKISPLATACVRLRPMVAALVVLLVAQHGGRAWGNAATRPDAKSYSDSDVLAVRKLAGGVGLRRWQPAIVETFADAKAKPAWTGGKIRIEDGCMVVATGADGVRPFVLQRELPAGLQEADGVQVQLWLQVEPVFRKVNNRVIASYQMQMNVGQVNYHFAFGGNGAFQRIIAPGGLVQGTVGGNAFAPGKLVHLTMELVGRQVVCSRDGARVSSELGGRAGEQLKKGAILSLSGNFKEIRLHKATYRALEPLDKLDMARLNWSRTAFGSQEEFARHLASSVIPRMDAVFFSEREQASELLKAVWPLSRPAVDAKLKSKSLPPEVEARLTALADAMSQDRVQPVAKGDPADAAPAGVKDMPVATQPDAAGAAGAVRVIAPLQPAPPPAVETK